MKSAYIAAALFGLIGSAGAAFAAPTIQVAQLPQLNIDKLQTSVSGASSGGYMAVQLHIVYSATFKQGAGVIAGGPYNCANGSVLNAIGRCLGRAPIPVAELVAGTRSLAASGAIDATDNLANANVYLFAGSKDSVVNPSTSADLQRYYQGFLPAANVVFKKDIEAEHAIVTDDYGAPCLTKATPFINNCGFDVAGAILQHLYGPLNARNSTPSGNLGGNLADLNDVGSGVNDIARLQCYGRRAHAVDKGAVGRPVVDQHIILAALDDREVDPADALPAEYEVAGGLPAEPRRFEIHPDGLARLAAFQETEFEHRFLRHSP